MASKILMGGMPELMENILNNLKNEPNSLYSCALVSRHWCKMSIPILWQNPFSFYKKPLFISAYFSSLDEDDIYVLKEYGINLKLSSYGLYLTIFRQLFDYAKFLKDLNLSDLELNARKWTILNLAQPLSVISSNTYYTYFDAVVNVVINLLLKSLFESGAVLHKLVLWFPESFEFKPEIFYLMERNELFFSRLQHLSLYIIPECNIESVTIFLKVLAKNITTISSLDLVIHSDFESRLFHSLFHAIIRIIKSQVQLKWFSLDGVDHPTEFYGIISALECQKNSLQEVIIIRCGYNKEFRVLKYCKTLETLRIRDCSPKLLNFLDCEISALEVFDCPIDVQTIPLILENSGLLLQRLSFDPIDFGNEIHEVMFFLETLKSFCPNITYLNIQYSKFSIQLLELIGNLQKLQFLSLCCFVDNEIPEEELKIRVMKFAEILPLTLQYLDLGDNWQPSIDILLSHCKAPLKKLLIYRLNDEKDTRALIEFCIRNKALNYVGIYKYSDLDENLRKEVETHVTNVALVPWSRIVVDC
ncbi:hypothetical protein F8M41_020123 [Gigaspora margarita]|uniref:F-box domain-containing protein n=1 Tax=Gigaspora margarita TaxID=4874 RepID=A0A8H4AJ14_GIGMA|nr:hypothetical protein F8M41_020123 [Gigaspora margarita]